MRWLAKSHLDADRHAFAHLEVRDGLAGMGDDRLLPGDLFEIVGGRLDLLGIGGGFANTDVQNDLVELRNFERIFVVEILEQPGTDRLVIIFPEARDIKGLSH